VVHRLIFRKSSEPVRCQRSVARRVLDIAVAQICPQRAGIDSVIRQLVAGQGCGSMWALPLMPRSAAAAARPCGRNRAPSVAHRVPTRIRMLRRLRFRIFGWRAGAVYSWRGGSSLRPALGMAPALLVCALGVLFFFAFWLGGAGELPGHRDRRRRDCAAVACHWLLFAPLLFWRRNPTNPTDSG
jgi:hypothetical protein